MAYIAYTIKSAVAQNAMTTTVSFAVEKYFGL